MITELYNFDMEKIVSLDMVVNEMKRIGEDLIPYNFPLAPASVEEKYNDHKMREVLIDGYDVVLHYSKSDYGEYFTETIQILGLENPFLPFCLIVKIAVKFLGNNNLALVEIFKDNRKIYCWTTNVGKDGEVILSPYQDDAEHCVYEGVDYIYLKQDQVNFY
jgi:hypothetical protein